MARGHPDYFGTPIFPQYGSIVPIAESEPVLAGTNSDLFEITAKGVILGGLLRITDVTDPGGVQVMLYHDGTALQQRAISDYLVYQYDQENVGLIILIQYQPEDNEFKWRWTPDIPFAESLKINVDNGLGTDITVQGILMYGDVA